MDQGNNPPPYGEGPSHPGSQHNDPRQQYHPNHDQHAAYHGMAYPLHNAIKSEGDSQQDLLEGTKVKTRDALVFAGMIAGFAATGYVKFDKVETKIADLVEEKQEMLVIIKEGFNKTEVERKEILADLEKQSDDFKLELRSVNVTLNSLDRTFIDHDDNSDRRFEDLENRVSSLFFKSRRSNRDEDQ